MTSHSSLNNKNVAEDGAWHFVDITGEMYVNFDGNTAKIRSIVKFKEYHRMIDL